jgi:lysophospholipase L1-like esterase
VQVQVADRLKPRLALGVPLLVALLAWLWLLRVDLPRAAAPTGGTTIVAFGDSLVAGRGASPGHDFVSVLSRRAGVPIINAGRSGDTTAAALARLETDVLARNPRIVIVLLGGNDFLRRVPPERAFENLGAIVGRIRARGAAVILVGVSVGLFSDPYAERYEALARRTSSGLVPDILDGLMGRSSLMADSIHPNDRGYALVADRVEPVLRDLLER